HGKKLTFFDLQKRLGRKHESADLFATASADVPVIFVAFDLLWMNGESFLRRPLRERREALRKLKLPSGFQMAEVYPAHSAVEIAELTEHFKKQTISNHGRYREVKPDIVLEIAFDSIQPSTRHESGLALRFPRIKAIRRDKTVDAIDTLAYARSLMNERAAG